MACTEKKATSTIEVAKLAGVSHMTVARVFSGNGGVSEQMRQRVLATARSVHYEPNPLARGLRGGATRTIGVFWTLINPSGLMASQIANRIRSSAYLPYLIDQEQTTGEIVRTLEDMRRRGVDGLILQASEEVLADPRAIALLSEFAAVVVVRMHPGVVVPFDEIVHDRLQAFREAARYFAQTGRLRPAFVGNCAGNRRKLDAFSQALEPANITVPAEACIHLKVGLPGECVHMLDARFGNVFPFDALMCTSDELAAPAMHWLRTHGYRVPEDVAVVGANNAPMNPFFDPPLASIERHDDEIVDGVGAMLFKRLENPAHPRQRAEVHMQFVWRESAGLRPHTEETKQGGRSTS